MNLIVLTGMPASGKSTAAKFLSEALCLPVLEKDAIKEALFDTLGFSCYAEKRKLDHVANAVLLRCARVLLENRQSLILDNNFDSISAKELDQLVEAFHCNCITVFFGGDAEVFYRRYVQRDLLHQWHLGHILQEHYPPLPGEPLDYTMTRQEFREKFEARGMTQFLCRGQRIDIDAADPESFTLEGLIEQIRAML